MSDEKEAAPETKSGIQRELGQAFQLGVVRSQCPNQ